MNNKGPILAGALGGVAPNLIRLIVNYSSPNPQHIINQPVLYFLAMVGFAALGGVVAWAFQETNLKQALFLGVSLPSLFQIGALQGTAPSSPPLVAPGTQQAAISLVSSAYAQAPPGPSPSVADRTLNLTVGTNIAYTVAFYGQNNALIRPTTTLTGSESVSVPPGAVKFAIQVAESTSTSYNLPTTPGAVKAQLRINEKPSSGFFQGLGLAKTPQYDISAQIQ
jgi:hypothetical protein